MALQKGAAQESDWRMCWLKGLQEEMEAEEAGEQSIYGRETS